MRLPDKSLLIKRQKIIHSAKNAAGFKTLGNQNLKI